MNDKELAERVVPHVGGTIMELKGDFIVIDCPLFNGKWIGVSAFVESWITAGAMMERVVRLPHGGGWLRVASGRHVETGEEGWVGVNAYGPVSSVADGKGSDKDSISRAICEACCEALDE